MAVMLSQDRAVFRYPFAGVGLSTEEPMIVDKLTHFLALREATFTPSGGIRKRGGRTRYNATATGATDTVGAVFDAWALGTAGVNTQAMFIQAGTQIYSTPGDNTGFMTSRLTGLTADRVSVFDVFDDILIFSMDNDTAPRQIDFSATGGILGATMGNLSGTPPNFAFSVHHINRQWASGNPALPSRLYYSGLADPQDYTGPTSGSVDIDPNDGDRIVGLFSHLDQLWVFKGPHIGSIHRITGDAPANFARDVFVRGVAPVSHNAIARVGNDLFFAHREGVSSLSISEKFGDMEHFYPSNTVRGLFRGLNQNRLRFWHMKYYERDDLLLLACSAGGFTTNNFIIPYQPSTNRWGNAWAIPAASLGTFIDIHGAKRMMVGNYTGRVEYLDSLDRVDPASTAYTFLARTPSLTFVADDPRFTERSEKIFHRIGVRHEPKGNWNLSGVLKIDDQADQTFTLDQGLGSQGLGSFTLGTDVLDASSRVSAFATVSGKGRTGVVELSQAGASQDVELYELIIEVEAAGSADDSVT